MSDADELLEIAQQAREYLEGLASANIPFVPVKGADAPKPAAALEPAPSPSGLTLEVVRAELGECTRCKLCDKRSKIVFGVGNPRASLVFVGEAPGADEDKQGEPFVGAAGQLLTKMINAMGLAREDVYIANIIKCRPPGNRTPKSEEALNCREYLTRQLELVRPKYICALGGCAVQYLLETGQSVGKLRGKFHNYRGIPVWVTYHPAFLLPHRSPTKEVENQRKREVWNDMKLLMQHMGRTIPPQA